MWSYKKFLLSVLSVPHPWRARDTAWWGWVWCVILFIHPTTVPFIFPIGAPAPIIATGSRRRRSIQRIERASSVRYLPQHHGCPIQLQIRLPGIARRRTPPLIPLILQSFRQFAGAPLHLVDCVDNVPTTEFPSIPPTRNGHGHLPVKRHGSRLKTS